MDSKDPRTFAEILEEAKKKIANHRLPSTDYRRIKTATDPDMDFVLSRVSSRNNVAFKG